MQRAERGLRSILHEEERSRVEGLHKGRKTPLCDRQGFLGCYPRDRHLKQYGAAFWLDWRVRI